MIVKESLKGMGFAAFNATVSVMAAHFVFGCDFEWFTRKVVFFGIFILPLIIVLYYTVKIMRGLRDKNPGNLIICIVLGPNLMIVPTLIIWLLAAQGLSVCLK